MTRDKNDDTKDQFIQLRRGIMPVLVSVSVPGSGQVESESESRSSRVVKSTDWSSLVEDDGLMRRGEDGKTMEPVGWVGNSNSVCLVWYSQ